PPGIAVWSSARLTKLPPFGSADQSERKFVNGCCEAKTTRWPSKDGGVGKTPNMTPGDPGTGVTKDSTIAVNVAPDAGVAGDAIHVKEINATSILEKDPAR